MLLLVKLTPERGHQWRGVTFSKVSFTKTNTSAWVTFYVTFLWVSGVFIVNFEHVSHLSSVSIVDFEQVNVSWVSLPLSINSFSVLFKEANPDYVVIINFIL